MTKTSTAVLALSLLTSCASTFRPAPNQPTPNQQDPSTQDSNRQDPNQTPGNDAAEAQGAKKRTTVTAQKYEQDILDVPRSITSIDAQQIRDTGSTNIKEAVRFVPNVMITEFTARRLSFPYVRGIGSGQGDPAVATIIDNVPQLTTNTTNLPLVDVERIEFLRGPMATLYGRNTIGGAMHVVTREPGDTLEYGGRVSFGNYGYQDYQAYVGAPLSDAAHLGFSIVKSQREGYTDNDFTGNDADSRDSWFGRGQLMWTPDDRNEVRVVVHGERARDGSYVLTELNALRARPNHINQDFEGDVDRDVIGTSVTWKHSGDAIDITSITGFQDFDVDESADFDFMAIDGVRRYTQESQTAFSQEFRFASAEDESLELDEDAHLRWLAGVSGFIADSDREAANVYRPGGAGILFPPSQVGTDRSRGSFDDSAFAIFGQGVLELGEHVEVTGAIRYDYERKEASIRRQFESPGGTFPTASSDRKETYDQVMPRVSAAYRFDDSMTAYGVVARGFKAGGFNLTSPSGLEAFAPEKSWTYEVGFKTRFDEGRYTAGIALFHIDWEDMQLSQFDATAGGYVTNAGEATSRGLELEATANPVEGLDLLGSIGFLDTEFDRFVDPYATDVRGKNLPFAPEMTASVGALYSHELADGVRFRIGGDFVHVGDFYYDAGNRGHERYQVANFRAGIGDDRWNLDFWVRNALDERYQPVAFQANPADPNYFVAESSAPRTFGVTLRIDLGRKKRDMSR
ncbi:MAG: TonB-dependent receptor [Planctomycetes bacterium]|nr:TonB-dependent receptor [Planctomycetota bacterium]